MRAPGYITYELLNLPALSDSHVDTPGFYIVGTQEDVNKPWMGFTVFESNSETTGYSKRSIFSTRASIGRVTSSSTIKTSAEVDYRLVDNASEIYVEMLNPGDELESVTEDEMLAGKNRFLVGNEIIGAANAVLVTTDYEKRKTYKLTTLIRGLKDTIEEMDSHQGFERFVHLDGPGVHFFEHTYSRVGDTKYYAILNDGQSIGQVPTTKFTSTGKTVAPFRPLSIDGTRNGSNDLTITWERQTRMTVRYLDQAQPFLEEAERYKIIIRQSANSEIAVREIVVAIETGAARTHTYTASQQTTDGLTPGNSITIELLQLSSTINDLGNRSVVTL